MRSAIVGFAIVAALNTSLTAGQSSHPGPGQSTKNSVVVTMVASKLRYNRELFWENIEIQADDGVVTLSGNVSTQERADLAVKLASETSLVKRVENKMTVAR